MTYLTARRRYRTFGLGIAVVLVALGALGYVLTATFTSAAPTTDVAAATSSAVPNPQPAPAAAPSMEAPTPAPTPAAAPVAKNKAPTDSAPGCAQRAMAAGKFNPGCAEYQGYLDPGRSAGRGPTSGEIQHAYGCAQGYIPKSQC